MESLTHSQSPTWSRTRLRDKLRSLPLPRPELAALLVLALVLDLWALGQNGWANEYYSAAVRSMAGSWHDFLFGSFDARGLMTVDKPPAALWVQALSVKAFGFGSWAILVPQALMGAASVGLLYDLVRRRWGRAAGGVAGLCLVLTPITVAISRHNNPDALLVLCCVAALWAFVRALEDGSTRWLVAAGALVGLGFEAKMGVALMVVPGMALAWLWVAPRGRLVALRQLLWAALALAAVGLAWPLMVELTPASSRPWIAGTSDNSVFSLILEYNGFGRLDGQTGGPASFGGGGPFGGEVGPLRLLNEALGGQAGWLLGLALAGGLGIAVLSRLRREDPRTGWIIAVGAAFAVVAVAFSFAGGIFHPYYVSLLAPFAAALVGATFAQARSGGGSGRVLGALAIGAGAVTEMVVIGNSASDLSWLVAPIVLAAAGAAFVLATDHLAARWGVIALAAAVGVLLVGPAIWSLETLGHPTSGTFPAGGPESASMAGVPGGGQGGLAGGQNRLGGGPSPGSVGGSSSGSFPGEFPGGSPGIQPPGLGGESAMPGLGGESGNLPGLGQGELRELPGTAAGSAAQPGAGTQAGPGAGGTFGGQDLTEVLAYAESHGGGTVAVESQSEAAAAIIESGAEVAGIGGFSGKESSVNAEWLEERIAAGDIRWILSGGSGPGSAMSGATGAPGGATGALGAAAMPGGGPAGPLGGDTRTGSESALAKITATCEAVPSSALETSAGALYDCAPSS